MSGECDKCGEHCLDCKCHLKRFSHMNAKPIPLGSPRIDPPPQLLETRYIDVQGREEHEALLRDTNKMWELGLDPCYEKMVYLRRWGSWLNGSISYSGEL